MGNPQTTSVNQEASPSQLFHSDVNSSAGLTHDDLLMSSTRRNSCIAVAVSEADIVASSVSGNNNNTTSVVDANTTNVAGETSTRRGNFNNNMNPKTIDFISSDTAVKHLFSLPYNNDRGMSMALHNLGNGTLLLDTGEDFGNGSNYSKSTASASTDNSAITTNLFTERSIFRRGRRRQRPVSWTTSSKTLSTADPSDCDFTPLRLSQLKENENSILTSLASFLKKEQLDANSENEELRTHSLLDRDHDKDKYNCTSDASASMRHSAQIDDSHWGHIMHRSQLLSGALPSLNHGGDSAVISPSPSNLIFVASEDNEVGNIVDRNNNPNPNEVDPDDPLGSVLDPPQHYLSQYTGVYPPSEPRQYVNWNFNDMKLLIASDAILCNKEEGGEKATQISEDSGDDKLTRSTSSLLAIRIEDVSALKSQIFESSRSLENVNALKNERLTYAEALLISPEKNRDLEGDNRVETAVGSTGGHDFPVVTSIVPSLDIDPQFPNQWAARLGLKFSPIHLQPTTSHVEDHSTPLSTEAGIEFEERKEAKEAMVSVTPSTTTLVSSAPICTVLDVYLDNIMANVPQLALVLREHGFVQSVKLLRTEDIPSLMMHPSTLDGESSSAAFHHQDPTPEPIFSPEIVEMNAAMLLRFLKSNCTRENSTYLLHRAAGETNVQLFDISSISKMRQRKWVWWLALCSYRFACRLDQLKTNVLSPRDEALLRDYRRRQRSLLQNTLDLLDELADMDGGRRHDTIGAAVCEHIADTYLWKNDDIRMGDSSPCKSPLPCASSSQPYRNVTVDCLNKAHDHLTSGLTKITPLLVKARQDKSPIEIEALSKQLYGIYHKLVNVNLRLADRHLRNYFASNLIQALRLAARMLSDGVSLLNDFSNPQNKNVYVRSVYLQYCWLWEYAGHFARSFAADGLWRDRGHTCGADIIGLLREVDLSCCNIREQVFGVDNLKFKTSVDYSSHGQVSLNSLSGIVILPKDFDQIETSVLQKEGCHEAIGAARSILNQKSEIKRDALLVLVAASICFGYSIDSYVFLASLSRTGALDSNETKANACLTQSSVSTTMSPVLRRLGDACNEIGKTLLDESRTVLLPHFSPPDNITVIDLSHVSAVLLASAKFWFYEGLEQFTKDNDLRNIALLRCNLCQCSKIRANTNVILPGTIESDTKMKYNSELHLQEAVDNLVLAHGALGQRESDPITWDMVSEELAATLLVLGVRRRQSLLSSSSEPLQFQALRLSPGAEKSIVEPIERACKIYESLKTARAAHQAAAANYQLALYYSKVWTCQRDEAKTREKLSAAFKHYGLAHQYFYHHVRENETTFVMLSLDFSNLYSSVSGEECLSKALMCCLDTRAAFSLPVAPEVTEQMIVLAETVESRVAKLLLGLLKIVNEDKPNIREKMDKFKGMYRKTLTSEYKGATDEDWQENKIMRVFQLLQSLYELYKA